jgi:hypothetical protein
MASSICAAPEDEAHSFVNDLERAAERPRPTGVTGVR